MPTRKRTIKRRRNSKPRRRRTKRRVQRIKHRSKRTRRTSRRRRRSLKRGGKPRKPMRRTRRIKATSKSDALQKLSQRRANEQAAELRRTVERIDPKGQGAKAYNALVGPSKGPIGPKVEPYRVHQQTRQDRSEPHQRLSNVLSKGIITKMRADRKAREATRKANARERRTIYEELPSQDIQQRQRREQTVYESLPLQIPA